MACRSGDLNGKFMMMLAQRNLAWGQDRCLAGLHPNKPVWFAWAGTTGRETRSAHVDAEAHVTPLMYSVIMKYHSISCLFSPRIQKPGAAKQAKNHTKELTEGERKTPTCICMAPLYSISTTEPRGPNPSIICTHTHRTVRSLEALAGYQIRASQSSLLQCS